jgi:DegV family protein with EDD domain
MQLLKISDFHITIRNSPPIARSNMAKSKIAIVTDSTANLSKDLQKINDIHVMPLRINWPGDPIMSLKDIVEFSPSEFYEKFESSPEIPTTSQPSPGEFVEFFQEIAKDHDQIVAVLVSAELSGTIKSAEFALNMLDDVQIELVNSKTTGSAMGEIAVLCAEMKKKGKNVEEITKFANEAAEITRTWLMVDTMDYLHKGGRVSGSKKMIGNVLSMKPLIHFVDGKMELFGSVRTKKKAIDTILDIIDVELKTKANPHISIAHANSLDMANYTAEKIRARFSPGNLQVAEMSPVIATHAGPGAIGISHLAMD